MLCYMLQDDDGKSELETFPMSISGLANSGNPLGDMSKIRREIKDSSIISDAHLVAIYHFLIKPIF